MLEFFIGQAWIMFTLVERKPLFVKEEFVFHEAIHFLLDKRALD